MDKELLQRYVEGNVSRGEAAKVVKWLDADEAHVREFMALQKLYGISILNTPEPPSTQKKDTAVIGRNSPSASQRTLHRMMRVAAIIIVAVAFYWQHTLIDTTADFHTLVVPAGQRAQLFLPDSTKVWMNAKSKLVYPAKFEKGKREVFLNGEAYFDVEHDAENPFIVKTERMNITVLGTRFNVSSYSYLPSCEASLIEGSIKLDFPGYSTEYIMKENEHAVFRDGKLTVTRIKDHDYFKWKEGLLCFNNETVENIIAKLQIYYDIEIIVNDDGFLKDDRYTGKFRVKDGIEQVLKVLQLEHKFSYTKDDDENRIIIETYLPVKKQPVYVGP